MEIDNLKYKLIYCIVIFFGTIHILSSQTLENAFLEASTNKENVIAVLDHYKNTGEKEKYKAAEFLIKNMSIHESKNYDWIDKDGNIVPFSELNYDDFNSALEALNKLKDSINLSVRMFSQLDLDIVTPQFLIKNIDLAFTSWKDNPWSRGYSFQNFCEFILPYRSLVEPLEEDWREEYQFLVQQAKYNLDDNKDPVEVCTQIIHQLKGFSFVPKNKATPAPLLSPQQILFRREGSCPDLANLALLASRSLGVAVSFEFTPYYAASSNRHFWNSVIDKHGNHIPFNGNSVGNRGGLPYSYNANQKRLGKVYRNTYSIQKNALASKLKKEGIPKGFLRSKNILDVTHEYVPVGSISFNTSENDTINIAYLNVFNNSGWRTVDWTERENGNFKFTNIGRDIVYLPGIYNGNKMIFSKYPVLLDKDGSSRTLKPDFNKVFECVLNRDREDKNYYQDNNSVHIESGQKYMLYYWNQNWKKLGITTANIDGAYFNKIPSNALFILRPLKPNGKERIFTLNEITKKISWY